MPSLLGTVETRFLTVISDSNISRLYWRLRGPAIRGAFWIEATEPAQLRRKNRRTGCAGSFCFPQQKDLMGATTTPRGMFRMLIRSILRSGVQELGVFSAP